MKALGASLVLILVFLPVIAHGAPAHPAAPARQVGPPRVADASAADAKAARLARALELGSYSYVRGDWFSTLRNYQEAARAGATDPEILYRMGYAAKQLRQPDEMNKWFGQATPLLEKRLAEGGTLADSYLLAAIKSAATPTDSSVQEISRRAIEKLGDGAFGPPKKLKGPDLFRLARLYQFVGETELSRETMELARASYRKMLPGPSDQSEHRRGSTRRAGHREVTLDPNDPYFAAVFMEGAAEKMAVGDYAGAAGLYEEVVRTRPWAPGAFYNLGRARLRQGDLPAAQTAWQKAKTRDLPYSTEASYAEALASRVIAYGAAHPEEKVAVEGPFFVMGRAEIERTVKEATASIVELYRAAAPAAAHSKEGEPPADASAPEAAGPVKTAAPPKLEAAPTSPEIERAEHELTKALLAYLVRGYPIRELAMEHQLFGFIFRKPAP